MRKHYLFFISLWLTIAMDNVIAQDCRSELLALLHEPNFKLQNCVIIKNLVQYKDRETWNALTIEKSNQPHSMRFSIWVLDKKGSIITKAIEHPVYQEEIHGEKLIEFEYQNKKTALAIGDFNNDGQVNFAFFIHAPPSAHFIMKGVNTDKMKLENLGYRELNQGKWIQQEQMTTGPNALISVSEKNISIQVYEETEVFELKGTQYEKVP